MVLAIIASREWEWASVMFLWALLSAQGACMLTIGSVPISLRRQIIENYALFIPGRRKKFNFISFGFFSFFNMIIIWIDIQGFLSFLRLPVCSEDFPWRCWS